MKIEKIAVKYRDNKFSYIELGRFGRKPSLLVWVSERLVRDGHIFFPVNGRVVKTEKGSFVLKASDDYVTHCIEIVDTSGNLPPAIWKVEPPTAEVCEYTYAPGSITGALISVPAGETVWVSWRKGSGWRDGVSVITSDGKYYEVTGLRDRDEVEEIRRLVDG
jgi:hypothetical protein